MNETDELRRRLVEATPEFAALAPAPIRARVRRRRRTTAAVVAVAALTGAAVLVPRLVLDRAPVPATAVAASAPVPTTAAPRPCPTRSPRDGTEIVDYADVVHLGGRDYVSVPVQQGHPVRAGSLGAVRCSIAAIRPGGGYRLQDGDATVLAAGTPLFSVRGLPSWFRIVTAAGRVYDSRPGPGARRGGDIVPLTGQVASIEWVRADSVVHRITDPATVSAIVAGVVAAPVRPDPTGARGDVGNLRFRLRDGTSVVWPWSPERGWLGGGIRLPARVSELLTR